MKQINPHELATLLEKAIPSLAFDLPADVVLALKKAQNHETHFRAQVVLDHLIKNTSIAKHDQVPICQDTGSVWLCLEIGPDVLVSGDVFSQVDSAVARAYAQAGLRTSLVYDSLCDRTNTGNNTPAFCEVYMSEKPGARLHIMLKGGGSDNASRLVMLPPASGKQGIIDELLRCVEEKAANACAPVIIGLGIGATFDKVAGLAKRALMRTIDEKNPNPRLADFEEELCELVNASGVGPGGLGGNTTALAVKVNTAPSHIAAFPLAINMGCSAMRRKTIEL